MAKLVVRQAVESPWYKRYLPHWPYLTATGLGSLVLLGFLWSATEPSTRLSATTNPLTMPVVTSAQHTANQADYLAKNQAFMQLVQQYDRLAAQGRDDYELHNALDYQSQAIVQALQGLEELLPSLGLNNSEWQQNKNRQVYLKDYWQAKQHFHHLRVSSLRPEQKPSSSSPEQTTPAVLHTPKADIPLQAQAENVGPELQKTANKTHFATPPAGVDLPADFCQLGQAGTCKAE
ncbi:hypothetical protein [Thiolinea disciformis]|uniref:hypothetical protein n=1 Tax=Thiolinea disciformis TaxID=125614 RepID=UPI000369B99C|nr:hypothetical protein [Thiolinea disciformis]